MKSLVVLLLSLGVLCGRSFAAQEPLRVVNGDFSDLSELKPFGGHGWYEGVPAGWQVIIEDPALRGPHGS